MFFPVDYPQVPPHVEYEITAMGKSLLPHIHGLAKWAKEHYSNIDKSRKKFRNKSASAVLG